MNPDELPHLRSLLLGDGYTLFRTALVGVAFVPLRDLSGRMKELGLA